MLRGTYDGISHIIANITLRYTYATPLVLYAVVASRFTYLPLLQSYAFTYYESLACHYYTLKPLLNIRLLITIADAAAITFSLH